MSRRIKKWRRIEPTVTNKIGWRTLISKTFVMPDGKVKDYQTYDDEGRVYAGVIAVTPDHKVILARQFRPGMEQIMDEVPGGGVEAGEDTESAALRELAEETGYKAGAVTYLGKVYKDAYNNATWHYYLATDCTPVPGGQHLDDTEDIEVLLVTIDQLLAIAREAKMTDTEAVLLAYDELQRLKAQE